MSLKSPWFRGIPHPESAARAERRPVVAWRQALLGVAIALSGPLVQAQQVVGTEVIVVDTAADPVSRFLSDKGLINTRPVTDLAQQMREKATDVASELVFTAMDFLGVRYRMGGTSRETGFDCSGFTRHVFENSLGLILPRRAVEQANMPGMMAVNVDELKPGDLVFFNTLRRTFSHVGIYVGDNKFIHSPRAGSSVRIEDMRQAYWQQRYNGARRAPHLDRAALQQLVQQGQGRGDASP